MTTREGVTLPELILVAWLFGFVLLALGRFAGAQGRLAVVTHERVRAADVVRTTDLVLNGELRRLAADDWWPGPDSIRLRAVRGSGTLCSATGSELRVRYRGVRRPDPTKDSVVLVTGSGTAGESYAVVGVVADTACGGFRLELDRAPPASAGLVLLFETGSYYLSDGALRYRRGRGGRQPVTEAVLEAGRFERTGAGLVARLVLHRDSVPRIGSRTRSTVVRMLNAAQQP